MRRSLLPMLLAGVLVLAGCGFKGAYDLPLPGGPAGADNSFTVTADFADVLNVVPKSPVMVNDVPVGEVLDVTRVGWHAEVEMRVRDDVQLPDNAIAQIRQVSLLGEKYIDLAAPVGPAVGRLGDGDHIPLAHTGRNPEVEEVLGALSYLLSGGGVGQLSTITHELNEVMDGRTDRLRDLLSSLDSVVGTLDEQKGDILRALQSLNALTATLNHEKDVVARAIDATGPAIQVLADQEHQLVAMLGALDRLGTVGTRVIEASKDDLLDQLRSLRPVLAGLNQAGESLAPGLNLLVSFPFPKEASEIVQGDYANTQIVANFDLSSLTPGSDLLLQLHNPLGTHALSQVVKCLNSGSLQSQACVAVLSSLTLLTHLIQRCNQGQAHGVVCDAVALLGHGHGGIPGLPGLPDVEGLTSGLTNGQTSPRTDTRALFGGRS